MHAMAYPVAGPVGGPRKGEREHFQEGVKQVGIQLTSASVDAVGYSTRTATPGGRECVATHRTPTPGLGSRSTA